MKRKNIVMALIIAVVTFFGGTLAVDAAFNAPDKLVINHYKLGNLNNPLNINKNFNVKQTSDGKFVYCIDYAKKMSDGKTYNKVSESKDLGLSYIVNAGYNDKTEVDYFVTQSAIWLYLADQGIMAKDNSGTIDALKTAVYSKNNDNNESAQKIRDLVANAKVAKKRTVNFNVNTDNVTFKLSKNGKYYVSELIEVNTNLSSYEVKFENAPKNTEYEITNKGVYVSIPKSKINEVGSNFKINIVGGITAYNTYIYKSTVSGYQPVAVPYSEYVTISKTVKATIEKVKENKETIVSISKKDITNDKELPGATLILRNEDNEIVETWVSTDEEHLIYNLPLGKYTLTEKIAPEGYELSSETIEFELTKYGVTKKVTMYNKPKVEIPKEEVIEVPVEPTSSFTSSIGSVVGLIIIALGSILIFRSTKENAR